MNAANLKVGHLVVDKNQGPLETGIMIAAFPWAVYEITDINKGRVKGRKFITHHLTKADAMKKIRKLKKKKAA